MAVRHCADRGQHTRVRWSRWRLCFAFDLYTWKWWILRCLRTLPSDSNYYRVGGPIAESTAANLDALCRWISHVCERRLGIVTWRQRVVVMSAIVQYWRQCLVLRWGWAVVDIISDSEQKSLSTAVCQAQTCWRAIRKCVVCCKVVIAICWLLIAQECGGDVSGCVIGDCVIVAQVPLLYMSRL